MATVLHAPSPPCGSSSQQPQPQPPTLHHRSSAAALHRRTLSHLSHSTSSSSLHSLAASPSKPRVQPHVPVRRQLHFGARHSPGRASTSSASSSDDEATSPRLANRRAAILRRMDAGGRLDTAGLPPSRIPVLSPSYRSPSSQQHPRPAWGVSPTKRSTSFSFNRPPPSSAAGSNSLRPLSIVSPSSPFARTSALLSPRTAADDAGPLSPDSPSPLAHQLPSLHALERPVASGSRRVSSDHRPLPMDVDDGPNTSPSIRREYRVQSDGHKLHSPFRSLSEGRPKAAKHTPPPSFLMPQPQSQPPKPQPLQRIRASFPSSTSLSGKSCASPAGSTDSRASSSRLAFEDARPSPEAFKVSLMKKGQGSMHGLARTNSSTVYQAPPTPNPKLSHLHWAPPHACADRSPRSTIPRPARSFLSHSLSCRQPPPSSLARQQPLAASWSAGSESSNAASANSPAISPRHKGVDPLARPAPPPPAPPPKSRAASMAKIQAQSDFLLAVDASMAGSPERVNGLGLGGIGIGLGLTGFPGFGKASVAAAAAAAAAAGGATKSGRSRSRRSGGIKRKGSHLDAPSIPNLATFGADPASSPPSFGVPRQGGRPPLKRASYAEDVFGSKFEIVGVVGRGMSGGVVYKALEKQSGVVAAVKVSPVYGGVRDRIRHLEEVDILRTLTRTPHPNVVSLLSSWEQAGRLHIHTELATGGDLASFLSLIADSPSEPTFGSALHDGSPAAGLDEARTWKVLAALSAGLAHIHALGILHLDIKPANVLITRERTVVLTDFGTATCWPRKRPSEILHGSGMGTAPAPVDELSSTPAWEEREGDRGYLSAEAVNGVVSKAGDVFSLGLLMLESLTNIIPPSNGDAWTRLRTDDFTDIEAPPPSPAVSSCSAFSPPAVDSASSAFSTRSHSSYLAADSPWTESESSLLLTPSVGGSLASPGVGPTAWASDTLTTLVKALMSSDASRRPSALDIGRHPSVARAAVLVASSNASAALVPEQPAFLAQVLEAARGARLTTAAPPSCAPATDTSALDLARDLERMDVDVDLASSGGF